MATTAASPEIFACLIKHRWKINDVEFGNTALRLVIGRDIKCVEWLLDHGADPNIRGLWPRGSIYRGTPAPSTMGAALYHKSVDCMELLVAYGAVLDEKLAAELVEYCLRPRSKVQATVFQYLFELGADPNCTLKKPSSTPLQLAARRGLLEKVTVLLRAGADRSVQDKNDKTPLEEARERGDVEMIDLLSGSFDEPEDQTVTKKD